MAASLLFSPLTSSSYGSPPACFCSHSLACLRNSTEYACWRNGRVIAPALASKSALPNRQSSSTVRNPGTLQCRAQTYTVEIEHQGERHILKVPEDETVLSVALEAGLDVPYDCQLGVCMTCPARLEKGTVDQTQGMLSDDVKEKGYALMCVSYPRSDCSIRSIPEEELLSLQLVTSSDP